MFNSSMRFTDAEHLSFGAEIRISNGGLHTRGPMGLEAMTTATWIVTGTGQKRKPLLGQICGDDETNNANCSVGIQPLDSKLSNTLVPNCLSDTLAGFCNEDLPTSGKMPRQIYKCRISTVSS